MRVYPICDCCGREIPHDDRSAMGKKTGCFASEMLLHSKALVSALKEDIANGREKFARDVTRILYRCGRNVLWHRRRKATP